MASPAGAVSAPRKWTAAEDRRLQAECEQQLREAGTINDWMAIAEKIPHRTNKDCRKRWSKICATLRKGPWNADEDARLRQGVSQHGLKWTLVAQIVDTRSADQCAKRWQHSLDPQLDRSEWKPEEDRLLLEAVRQYGQSWTTIAQAKFPRRSKTDIKNRYSIILRRLRQRPSYLPLPSETTEDDDDEFDSDFELDDSNQAGIGHHLQSPSSQHSFTTMPYNYSMPDLTRNVPPYLTHDYRTSSGSSGSSGSSASSNTSPFTPPPWEPNNDFMNQSMGGSRMIPPSRHNSEVLSPSGTSGLMNPLAMNMDGATNMTDEEFMSCMDGLEGYVDITGGPASGFRTPSTLTITIEDADPHHIDGITSMLLRSKSKFRMQQS